jgi:asparagine synthase (glutamine-hydrolysing)
MGQAVANRGPDSSGVWSSEKDKIGLSHSRLAIVDLSAAGHQPMESEERRYVISFNGEIYNHLDMRKSIESEKKIIWRGHSDTETLLAGIELWGFESTLKKTIGMFAVALWDKEEKALFLARDRFGEKPLYYSQQNEMFIFGSETKSLRAHPKFKSEISRNSLALLMRHNYIPAPYSIYEEVFKVMPGTYLKKLGKHIEVKEYWSTKESLKKENKFTESFDESLDSLEKTLKLAISRQMSADVPLGAFLSGGIDSSLIVSLMQSMSEEPVKTFSIGFYEKEFNEAEYAKKVAGHLGTDHTEIYVSADDALKVVNKLADIYDEPFSDSSQIPTYLVSQMAREYVTVTLSGDGGDELFCGYTRYLLTDKLWSKLNVTPLVLRKAAAKVILSVSVDSWNRLKFIIPKKWKMINLGDKLHKAAPVLESKSIDELYQRLVSHWHEPERVVIGASEPLTALTDEKRNPCLSHPIHQMMALDTISYLSDDILVKVDRAAMANSLEVRIPFLDHTVYEKAWSIPLKFKLRNGNTKECLRKILFKYIPQELIERPKAGFSIPLGEWLRGPLKVWAERLLEEERLYEEGFFDTKLVRKKWNEHQLGKHNWQYLLWDVLMFQLWYERHHK